MLSLIRSSLCVTLILHLLGNFLAHDILLVKSLINWLIRTLSLHDYFRNFVDSWLLSTFRMLELIVDHLTWHLQQLRQVLIVIQQFLIYQLVTIFQMISDSIGNGLMLIAHDIGDRIVLGLVACDVVQGLDYSSCSLILEAEMRHW